MLNGKIYGNIKSQKSVVISSESSIKGDIECDMLDLNGKVNGNSIVYTTATLGKKRLYTATLRRRTFQLRRARLLTAISR